MRGGVVPDLRCFRATASRSTPTKRLASSTIAALALALLAAPATAGAENAAAAWGENELHGLAAGYSSTLEESPVASLPGVANIASLYPGFAVLTDGTVDSWGPNTYGWLGDGSKEGIQEKEFKEPFPAPGFNHVQVLAKRTPTEEPAPLTEAKAISASGGHAMALLNNHTVMAWGNDEYGEDGKGRLNPNERENGKGEKETTMAGTSPSVAEPVEWERGGETHKLENVVKIAESGYAGSGANFAIVENPTSHVTSLWAWGKNKSGQLGLGKGGEGSEAEECKSVELGKLLCSTYPRQVEWPEPVAKELAEGKLKIVSVGSGYEFAAALLDNGAVYAWGDNNSGQLGTTKIPTTGKENRSTQPVPVEGLSEEAQAIGVGDYSVLALLKGGAVEGWGANGKGQLGEEAGQLGEAPAEECGQAKTLCRKTAHPVSWKDIEGTHELSNISAITEGYDFGAALHEGKVLTFGDNSEGQLGLGDGGPETCHEEREIKEKSGKLVNRLANESRCKGPEECVGISESNVKWRGAWSASTTYNYGEGVEESGSKYVAIQEPNHNRKPSETTGTWWALVAESTGAKLHQVTGTPCGRAPHQVEGIGAAASITAGVRHVETLLQSGVAPPPQQLTMTAQSKGLAAKWRVPAGKDEVKIRLCEVPNPAEPDHLVCKPFTSYKLEPLAEIEETTTYSALSPTPYVVQIKECWPECESPGHKVKGRRIVGTPLL